jgi:hypothetical protein
MDLDRFLNLVATVFGGIGSIYVLKGIASRSPNLIERMSRTYVGFSSAQIDSLAAQKADSIVGIVLVLIALIIAALNLAFVPPSVRLVDRWTVALVAASASVAYISLVFVGHAIHRSQKLAVGRLIATQEINRLFASKRHCPRVRWDLSEYTPVRCLKYRLMIQSRRGNCWNAWPKRSA